MRDCAGRSAWWKEISMPNNNHRTRYHLANERTFLAWVRTSIGHYGVWLCAEKFSLLIRQFELIKPTNTFLGLYSSFFGISLVVLGLLICLLAFIKFKKCIGSLKMTIMIPHLS